MKVGLYFGSFNPVHHGHLLIANYILNETDIDKIWFIVSPQNPLKPSASLLNEYHRLHLVNLAIENDGRLRASDIEFGLSKPSYTATTLAYLSEKYINDQFFVIMGSDSFSNLTHWKNYEVIIKNYPILVFERPGFTFKNPLNANVQKIHAPLLNISATEIRKYIKLGKCARYMVPNKVLDEIISGGYYK